GAGDVGVARARRLGPDPHPGGGRGRRPGQPHGRVRRRAAGRLRGYVRPGVRARARVGDDLRRHGRRAPVSARRAGADAGAAMSAIRSRWLLAAALLLVGLIDAALAGYSGLERLATMAIVAIVAMSLDLLVGVAGMVSLGHALFVGLGAYAM